MNGDIDRRMGKMEDAWSNFRENVYPVLEDRVGNLETEQQSCQKMQDERHEAITWYMRFTLGGIIGIIALLIKQLFLK